MGCCHYSCDHAEREPVERLIALITRWCDDRDCALRRVNVRACSLEETEPWPTTPRLLKFVCEEVFKKKLLASDAELEATYAEEGEYHRNAREQVDLLGVVVENLPRGDFLFMFDLHAGGRLVRFVPEDPADYQATDKQVRCPCLSLGSGYASDVCDEALPRFLALCKARYLPALSFSCLCAEEVPYLQQFFDDENERRKIQELTEDEFYKEYLADHLLFG
jgi:hypothetical protein